MSAVLAGTRSAVSLFVSSVMFAACLSAGGGKQQTSELPRARSAPELEPLLAQMTLAEKIGQMTQVDRKAVLESEVITDYFIGSMLNGGDSLPEPNTADSWADTYDHYQAAALRTRLGIPLLYGIDAVHGHNGVRGAVVFPHNIGLGATRDPALVERVAQITAKEVAGSGIDWTFAPCIAVPQDERWGRTYEGFGETAELAQLFAPAVVRGLQGKTLAEPSSVLACAKHFIGDGGTLRGKDRGDTQVSEERLRALHMPGYQAAIAAGVGSVMVSYSSVNGAPMHGSKYLITDLLKGELGFTGFVITDWEGIDKMPGSYEQNIEKAINAGVDMVMVPMRYALFIRHLTALVESGRVPMTRIDDAVRRILRKKIELGLWLHPFTDRVLTDSIGSPEHRAVAREAVQKSLVLLKNEGAVLPLSRGARVHVGGPKADDVGAQCGGWTVSWQGKRGPITPGTSILRALRDTLGGANVSFDEGGKGGELAEVAIAVLGEEPYAEGEGDRSDLSLSAADRALLSAMRKEGRPLIVVLLSGRPMVLSEELAGMNALVAAFLPGTEGQGVVDVLVGDVAPSGKLPHSWPRSNAQIPVNYGDSHYDPLFAYGFGLSYAETAADRATPQARAPSPAR